MNQYKVKFVIISDDDLMSHMDENHKDIPEYHETINTFSYII